MDEQYDVIILGTGLIECVLSGVLSCEGKKVLHIDRNDYYGAQSASLNLTQLFKKFRNGEQFPQELGKDRDYNIDLIPKFMMANGDLVKILIHTDVTRYLEFKQISGSYVYREGKVYKVPSSQKEAISTSLMGLFEKNRLQKFFEYVQSRNEENPSTHAGIDLDKSSMAEVFKKFSLEPATQSFIGHALALHQDDSYLDKPARETFNKIVLYMTSMAKYGKSPYLYPLYGLGELPQGFARLSAIYGGTYMLDKPVDEIVYENGKFAGVKSGSEIAKAKQIIGDPSYFKDKVKKTGQVIRAIYLTKEPLKNTDNSDSVQIIIPQNQIKRKHDIYVACVSSSHNVCPPGYYLVIVSTIVETDTPEKEIEPAMKLVASVVEKFVEVSDILEPISDGKDDETYISKTYDSTSHFETTCDDIKDIYRRMTGKEMELKQRPAAEES